MKFKTGYVYWFKNCRASYPIKDKFAICVSAENSLFLFINSVSASEKRPYQHEKNHVFFLDIEEINFLSHRSYINVSKIQSISEKDCSHLKEKDPLNKNILQKIKIHINKDKQLSTKYKKIINSSIQ